MKKIIVILLAILITGCKKQSKYGDKVVMIEAINYTTDYCDIYTGFNHNSVIGPCNLYKVGDTLKLK